MTKNVRYTYGMENRKKVAPAPKLPGRKPYRRPELTRYQRMQELTRGDSPTGQTIDTCPIRAHCESSET